MVCLLLVVLPFVLILSTVEDRTTVLAFPNITLRLREAPSRDNPDRGMGLGPSRLPLGVRNWARGYEVI